MGWINWEHGQQDLELLENFKYIIKIRKKLKNIFNPSFIPNNQKNGLGDRYTSTPYIPQKIGQNKPEGEAPPGKVWSPEHGHWHEKSKNI